VLQLIAVKRANFIEEEGGDVKYDLIKSKHDDLNYVGRGSRKEPPARLTLKLSYGGGQQPFS
jgi:hypothetical protein